MKVTAFPTESPASIRVTVLPLASVTFFATASLILFNFSNFPQYLAPPGEAASSLSCPGIAEEAFIYSFLHLLK